LVGVLVLRLGQVLGLRLVSVADIVSSREMAVVGHRDEMLY